MKDYFDFWKLDSKFIDFKQKNQNSNLMKNSSKQQTFRGSTLCKSNFSTVSNKPFIQKVYKDKLKIFSVEVIQ